MFYYFSVILCGFFVYLCVTALLSGYYTEFHGDALLSQRNAKKTYFIRLINYS